LSIPFLLESHSKSTESRCISDPASLLGNSQSSSPAAEIPIHVLLSDDGALGVAFLLQSSSFDGWDGSDRGRTLNHSRTFSFSPSIQEKDVLGKIVIFPTPLMMTFNSNMESKHPHHSCLLTASLHCSNLRIAGFSAHTTRNLLWSTSLVPVTKASQNIIKQNRGTGDHDITPLCDGFRRVLSAYILFNDEDDGYRITWITNANISNDEGDLVHQHSSPLSHKPQCNILQNPDENAWEKCFSEADTGRIHHGESGNCFGPEISYERYLRVDALLNDILHRRQFFLFKEKSVPNESLKGRMMMPEFFYNLVSVSNELQVTIAIVFSNLAASCHTSKKSPPSLGVVVMVSLWDQSYNELKWVQHPSCRGEAALKGWCHELAMNWRMRGCGVGIFCVDKTKLLPTHQNWAGEIHECNIDEDLDDDINEPLWENHVSQLRSGGRNLILPPKHISMSSLYTSADMVSNQAVNNAIPVKRIISRKSPIELIYG